MCPLCISTALSTTAVTLAGAASTGALAYIAARLKGARNAAKNRLSR
jgi:hypothetical protein